MNDDINGATEQLCYWMGRNCQGEREGGGGGRADKKGEYDQDDYTI